MKGKLVIEFVDLKHDGYLYIHMTEVKAYNRKFNSCNEAYVWLFKNFYHTTIVVNELDECSQLC